MWSFGSVRVCDKKLLLFPNRSTTTSTFTSPQRRRRSRSFRHGLNKRIWHKKRISCQVKALTWLNERRRCSGKCCSQRNKLQYNLVFVFHRTKHLQKHPSLPRRSRIISTVTDRKKGHHLRSLRAEEEEGFGRPGPEEDLQTPPTKQRDVLWKNLIYKQRQTLLVESTYDFSFPHHPASKERNKHMIPQTFVKREWGKSL